MLRGQPQRRSRKQYEGGWSDAPAEVLERVLLSLPAKDCWNARQIASQWSSLARRIASFEVSIPTMPNKISSKLKILSEQGIITTYPRVKFSLSVDHRLHLCECATMLAEVHGLVSRFLPGTPSPIESFDPQTSLDAD